MIPPSFYTKVTRKLNISTSAGVTTHCLWTGVGRRKQFRILRDDLLHPVISGNKWRKLAGYLYLAECQNSIGLLTFGGAYSNHLHAAARTCEGLGLSLVAVVKGFQEYRDNPTMRQIDKRGADIVWLSPAEYEKKKSRFEYWQTAYPRYCIVPEGGAGSPGKWGFSRFFREIKGRIPSKNTVLTVASGTGTTAAGMADYRPKNLSVEAWPVVSEKAVRRSLSSIPSTRSNKKITVEKVLRGRFAKWDRELVKWIGDFYDQTGVLLDPIYTGPVFRNVLKRRYNRRLLLYHSGGLQGWQGYIDRFGDRINSSIREQLRRGIPFDIE